MKVREEVIESSNDSKAARGLAFAAVIQAIPLLVWGFLIALIVLFLALAVGFHIHDMPAFADAVLHWILWGIVASLVLLGIRLGVKGYGIYHDVLTKHYERRIGRATAERQEHLADKAAWQNAMLRGQISIVEQMPVIIQYAIDRGHNIELDNKGTLRVQNYLTGAHFSQQAEPAQISAPDMFLPPPYKFSDVLNNWSPSKDGILLAKNRDLITVPIGEPLCHTTFTGNTDAGKTNDERFILIQLLYLEQIVFLCDMNYQRFRVDKKQPGVVYDYSLIESQLAYQPAVTTAQTVRVLQYLISALEERRTARRKAIVNFPDIYLFMDELPAFCSEDKSIMGYVGRIVREARQYGIFFIGAAQDLLNDTMQAKAGAYRDNLLTNFYGGGDSTTARMVLNLAKGETIDERGLGVQGVKYLRAKGAGIEHDRVRTPYADNEATLMLLEGRTPATQLERLFTVEADAPAKQERTTGELPALDGDLQTVLEAARDLQANGQKASARAVERETGIDKDRANNLLNRLEAMGHITR